MELQIAEREDQQLAELHQEYANLVRMVANIKEEIEQQIKLQYAAATRAFREQADACKREIQYSRGFDRWSAEGRELLANLRGHFHSEKFNTHYRDYENFAWRQGELLLKDMQQSVERVKLTAKKTLSELRTTSQAPLLAHLANSLQLSQAHSNSQLDTSLTSLDDFSRTLFSHQDPSQNEFIEPQQMPKHRNSDCLEKVLSPIAEAGSRLGSAKLVKPQNKLNSSILSPEPRKKENNPLSHSMVNTTLQRVKSSSRMESSMISPKNKSRAYRSSDAVRPKPDPLRVVKDYEKRAELLELNLSDCELTDESLVYFLERALNSHTPSSLNLERNQLSMGGIYKFMPYVVKCRSVNLSKTGLGEGCLDWLLKLKTPFALEELNLAGNGISRHRNRPKL